MGILRLLVVEGGAPAPVCSDVREDWVRAPVTDDDLRARVATLRAKAGAYRLPQVDPNGVLRYAGRSITLSPSETDLLECLVRRFGVLVTRDTLSDCLPDRPGGASRNALDLHIMRLRRRIRPLGLVIRTVWGRGYLLDTAEEQVAAVPEARPEPRIEQRVDTRAENRPEYRTEQRGRRPEPVPAAAVRADEPEADVARPLVAAEVAALRWAQSHSLAAS